MRKSYIKSATEIALAQWCRDNSIPALLRFTGVGRGKFIFWSTREYLAAEFDSRYAESCTLVVREQDEVLVRLWLGGDAI